MSKRSNNLLDGILDGDDGFFTVDYREGQAFITVHPPGPEGTPVVLADVLARLKILKVPTPSHSTLTRIIDEAAGEPQQIGPWPEGSIIRGKIQIAISDDGMTASAFVITGRMQEKEFTPQDIFDRLEEKGVTHGIQKDAVEGIITKKQFGKEITVAEGKPAGQGRDGSVRFLFPPEPLEFETNEKGGIDYRTINKIKTVSKDTKIAELLDPEYGEDGYTIFGVVLPSKPGKPGEILPGRNTWLDNDKRNMYAAVDGYLTYAMRTVHVEDICRLPEVNFETGNVKFNGTVMAGKVENGFRVDADGSIIVGEPLERVYLNAAHNIEIRGGIRGKGQGLIEAAGDVTVKFAENANIITRGNLHVKEGLVGCNVLVDNTLELDGERADIMGGRIICGNRIIVNKLGAKVETRTEIFLGIPPAVIDALADLKKQQEEHQAVLTKILHSLGPGWEKKLEDQQMDPDTAEKIQKLKVLKERYEQKLGVIDEQMDMIAYSYEPNPKATILVRTEIYPGVRINMGKIYRVFRGHPTSGPVEIFLNKDEITLRNV